MTLRATSFEIGIASMATLLYADCAPWASATNPSHRPLLGRTVLPNSDQSGASVWIISRSGAKGHSRRILRAYARYYNGIRTHRLLDKMRPPFALSNGSATRGIPDPRRTPSPLRPGLSFRYTQPLTRKLAILWLAASSDRRKSG